MNELMDDLCRNLSCPAALGRVLEQACDAGLIGRHVNALVDKMIGGDESHLGTTNARAMLLAQRGDTVLQIRRVGGTVTFVDKFSQSDRFVHVPPSNAVLVIRGSAPVTVHRFRLPAGLDRAAFQRGIPIERLKSLRYDGAPVVETPADCEIRDYECPSGDAWMLRINYRPYATDSWFFDKETLLSTFATSVSPESSSLVTLCHVFAAAHDVEAKPLVEELARHGAHFVRWAAVQAMGQIDGDRALELIAESRLDPHPHIRAAAQRAYAKFGEETDGRHVRS